MESFKMPKNIPLKHKKEENLVPGTVYLACIPEGFDEEEIKGYFSQFGSLQRFRLARSKRTGRSKGYAFIEFECDEVAKIVAQTMNNYLMFEKIMKCRFIPPEKVNASMFLGYKVGTPLQHIRSVNQYNKLKNKEKLRKNVRNRMRKINATKKMLHSMGIEFDFQIPKLPETSVTKVPKLSPKSQSLNNTEISTQIIEVDSSEEEISFCTPPGSRKITKIKIPPQFSHFAEFLDKPVFKGSTPISQTPFGFKVFREDSFATPIPKAPLENKKAHRINSKQCGFVVSPLQKKASKNVLSTSAIAGNFNVTQQKCKKRKSARF